jgi:hypothetical protein
VAAETIAVRVALRASQALTVELKLGGTPARQAFQSTAYQNDAFQVGGLDIFRDVTLLREGR